MEIRRVPRPPIGVYPYPDDEIEQFFEPHPDFDHRPERVVVVTNTLGAPVELLDGTPPPIDLQQLREERRDFFREFAALDREPSAAIAEFADRFGLLGIPSNRHGQAEWIAVWREEISAAKTVVEDWEYVRRFGRTQSYRQEWSRRVRETMPSETELYFYLLPEMVVDRKEGIAPETFSNLSGRKSAQSRKRLTELRGRAVERARRRIHDLVGSRVAKLVTPSLSRTGNTFSLSWEPQTLIGVIWFQIAQVVTGATMAGSCEWCGERLLDRRRHTRFCSDNHRALASQQRNPKPKRPRRTAA